MNPTLNGSSALQHFKHSNAIEIRNGIMFDFYLGLPHVLTIKEPHLSVIRHADGHPQYSYACFHELGTVLLIKV